MGMRVAECTNAAEQEHADQPGRGGHCRADDPTRLTRPPAGQGANTGIEADPDQRRGHHLADGQNKNERHFCLLSPNRFPTSAMVRCGTKNNPSEPGETHCCAAGPISALSSIKGPTGMYS